MLSDNCLSLLYVHTKEAKTIITSCQISSIFGSNWTCLSILLDSILHQNIFQKQPLYSKTDMSISECPLYVSNIFLIGLMYMDDIIIYSGTIHEHETPYLYHQRVPGKKKVYFQIFYRQYQINKSPKWRNIHETLIFTDIVSADDGIIQIKWRNSSLDGYTPHQLIFSWKCISNHLFVIRNTRSWRGEVKKRRKAFNKSNFHQRICKERKKNTNSKF